MMWPLRATHQFWFVQIKTFIPTEGRNDYTDGTVSRLVSFFKFDFSPRVKMPHNVTKMTRTSEITEWSGWSRKWQFRICMELLSICKWFWHLKMDSPSRKLYFRKDTWATGIENQGSAVLMDEEVESPNYYQLYVLCKRYHTWREEES